MPREAEGARLWLRPSRDGRKSSWVIKDGGARISTGFGAEQRREAEKALATYIIESHRPQPKGKKDPHTALVADILNLYLQDVAPRHARPYETARRISALLKFFGTKTLEDLNGTLFREYTASRKAPSAARRELEDFRAAVKHYFIDDLLPPKVNIPMPEKGQARQRWLTHGEAAHLLWAAWRNSVILPGGGKRYISRHIARFILVGLYTGTRASRICSATFTKVDGRSHIDLERGMFYRRPEGERETTKRAPPIPLPSRLITHMRRWDRLGLCQNAVVEWEGQSVERINKGFKTLVDKIGLEGVTPHILRHTAITWAMQQGVKIYDAEDYFGVSAKILKDVYGHHHPDHTRDVGEAITLRRRR